MKARRNYLADPLPLPLPCSLFVSFVDIRAISGPGPSEHSAALGSNVAGATPDDDREIFLVLFYFVVVPSLVVKPLPKGIFVVDA